MAQHVGFELLDLGQSRVCFSGLLKHGKSFPVLSPGGVVIDAALAGLTLLPLRRTFKPFPKRGSFMINIFDSY